jgi:hypothetical protein
VATGRGPITTLTPRVVKELAPCSHDGRPPTLEDAVKSFNPILVTRPGAAEKAEVVAFLRQL